MITVSKSRVARIALGLVALAGVVGAVPASARPWEGREGWGHGRGRVERGYDDGYRQYRVWRPMWHHARMMEWRDGYARR